MLSGTVLTLITCQYLNYMLQIPAALYLACHFIQSPCFDCHSRLSRVFTDVTQLSSERKYKNISALWEKQCRKITFVLLLLNIMALMCPTFIFSSVVHCGYSSSEQRCAALFYFTCPIVQHQVVLQRGFDVLGLLWAKCKSAHRHEPGDCMSWQLARHLVTMFPLCCSGKKFGASFCLSD